MTYSKFHFSEAQKNPPALRAPSRRARRGVLHLDAKRCNFIANAAKPNVGEAFSKGSNPSPCDFYQGKREGCKYFCSST